ncbi:response regulator transcription factor [Streptomyces sp. SD31]|uniref:response regulator transcription factor n=1 Tax=Streptomyces sp. SD31 TaxID=3452208 RepID=UPI003F8C2E26
MSPRQRPRPWTVPPATNPPRVARHRFDLVVLGTTLPDVANPGRERRPAVPHRPPVLLTEYDHLHRLVPELGLGERDYVTKPFRVAEVLARIQVLLRGPRTGPPRGNPLEYGDLVLDDTVCRARRGTRALLLGNAHRVLSKEQIGRHVWGDHRDDNATEQLVSRLRRKVDRDDDPALIHTRRGFAYARSAKTWRRPALRRPMRRDRPRSPSAPAPHCSRCPTAGSDSPDRA